jgi:hypothetical protein
MIDHMRHFTDSYKSADVISYALSRYVEPFSKYDDTIKDCFAVIDETPRNKGVIEKVGVFEAILEWWIGEVKEIGDNYFFANLRDMHGNKSIVEFYRDVLSDEDWKLLVPGTEFAFYVSRVDRVDGRRYVEKLEISTPYIWKAGDEDRATTLLNELISDEVVCRIFEE